MNHRNNLYKRYGLLTDRVGTLLGFSKKEAHAYIKDFKGVSSLKKLSNYQLWELNHELMAYLAESGIEFYFGEDLSDKTLKELNIYYNNKSVMLEITDIIVQIILFCREIQTLCIKKSE